MNWNLYTFNGSDAKGRDASVDILKFFAVFLIINSHADICYPKFSFLATGGAIGDCLFLFCSGYSLLWSAPKRFDNFYKRRINRIYPSVFAVLLIQIWLGFDNLQNLTWMKLLGGGGQFVVAIMIYYVLFYIVQKYFVNKISLVIIFVTLLTFIAYCFFPYKNGVGENGIYGTVTIFRWIPYFIIMLLGAWIGLNKRNGQLKVVTTWRDLFLMIICLIVFYGIQLAAKKSTSFAPYQIVSIFFLVGVVFYLWRCCNSLLLTNLYKTKIGNLIIMAVSGLCLESYLIQFSLFTDKLNSFFPFNIPVIMTYILIMAYICRCLARIISQTFKSEDYNWKSVFAI